MTATTTTTEMTDNEVDLADALVALAVRELTAERLGDFRNLLATDDELRRDVARALREVVRDTVRQMVTESFSERNRA